VDARVVGQLRMEGGNDRPALAQEHGLAVELGQHLDIGHGDEPVRAVFIRAPWIEEAGPDVEVLAEVDGHPVLARQGRILVAAFHPELTDDTRVHERFLNIVREETRVGSTERDKRAEVPALPAPGAGVSVRA
jgi:hypothetical protein